MAMKKNQKINFRHNLKEYWSILRVYKLHMFIIVILLLIMNFIEWFSSFLFKLIIDKGTAFSSGALSSAEFTSFLLIVAGVYLGIEIIYWISNWAEHTRVNKLDTSIMFDLKKKYFNHLIGLSHSFYTKNKTGSLISRLLRGGNAIERMTDVFVFNGIPLLFQLTLVIGSLIYFDATTALILGIIVILFVVYSVIIQKIQEPYNLEMNNCEDREKANVADIFTNIDSIKYFGKENYIKKRFFNLADKTRESFLKSWNYYRWMSTGQAIILGFGTLAIVYFSVLKVLAGTMSIGTLVFIYSIYYKLLGPLYGFVYNIRNFYSAMADFQALFAYRKIESDIKDKFDAEELKIKQGEVEFRDVCFNYDKRKIIENFNLKINKNQKIAFVGHSGSGKTTLIKLLYRLYDVDSGSIFIDGKDIREVKHESLRSEMSVVPQECVLFDDTIYNNIAFSRSDATRKEVLLAIKFAQLDKIIAKLPKKENTVVGERGIKLSGGEKQRVSIARAILADKKILVMDEATSSLDSQTEHEIQEDLKELMNGRTSIVIAHRLSTIMSADKIIVMKNGKIVQQGTHRQLINQNGEYKNLWSLQRGGYIK